MALLEQTRPLPDVAVDSPLALRTRLAGRAAALSVTSFLGIPLFTLWVVFVALSPLTLVAPALVPIAWLLQRFATANRKAAGHLLGAPIPEPYRRGRRDLLGRITGLLRDPARWRDAWWAISHVVVGAVLSMFSLALLAGSVLHLIYPFLYAITPQQVFGRPYNLVDLHSVAQSFLLVPIGVLGLTFWWFVAPGLARAEARYTRSLLR